MAVSSPARGGSGRFCSSWWVMGGESTGATTAELVGLTAHNRQSRSPPLLGVEKPLGQLTRQNIGSPGGAGRADILRELIDGKTEVGY